MKLSSKGRLKKRINAYRTLGYNYVYLLETDFKGVFSPMMTKKDVDTIDKLIEKCSEDECVELNNKLDCYQIDKRLSQ